MIDEVILVNQDDVVTGQMEKLQAHKLGMLHRAFSIFIFNSQGQLLLQQRASGKYHSGGRWTNTCCSHPRPGEELHTAAERRLHEEMGLKCALHHIFKFQYFARVSDTLCEHEIDHVFFGTCNDKPVPNPNEVADFKYMHMDALGRDLARRPSAYSEWLGICFNRVYSLCKLFML